MTDKLNVKIKALHADAVIPRYATEGSAGFDLVAVEDIIIEPGETKLIRTGLAFELPSGYELQIRPRSGVTLKTKLRVQLGTVDSDYRGEVGVIVDNIDKPINGFDYNYDGRIGNITHGEVITINRGDRIAQGVINAVPQAKFNVVDELNDTERGNGGFGSTGVKERE